MKKNIKLATLSAFFLSIFTLGALSNNSPLSAHADDWTIVDTSVVTAYSYIMYDASDGYIFFRVNPNDYTSLPSDYKVTLGMTYFNVSDYNFLSYIQISHDNQTYVPFSTIYNQSNINYFFKDGTFRFGLRRNAETIREDGSYEYIKVLQGCEFPSYNYCSTGTNKTKYVQKETTISKLNRVVENGPKSGAVSYYEQMIEKKMMNYTGIAYGWNNANYSSNQNYRQLILSFGEHNVDFLANDHNANNTNRASDAYDIGKKLTINGLPIYKIRNHFPNTHVGYDHGFAYFYVNYPIDVLLMNKNNLVPTLHIEEGTEFMDVLLPEVNLKFVGGGWIANNSNEFRIDEPLEIYNHTLVDLPHHLGTDPHPILGQLPEEGCKLAFTVNTNDIDLTNAGNVFNIDGLYKCTLSITPSIGTILLLDKDSNNAVVQQFDGYLFAQNSNYTFEIEVICGQNTTVKFAINHLLVIDYTFSINKTGASDIWVIDTSGQLSIDVYQELDQYSPIINYGGTSSYDFIEGDSVYNFANVVNAFDLYDESVGVTNIVYEYEDGAVSDGKYNAGTWTLTIKLIVDGHEIISKTITINVHGNTSLATIYYDDGEPIKVPVGSKLNPPINPNTYREGEYDYVFDGWYFEGAKWDFENDIVQGDMHLYSRFKPVSPHYIVTAIFEGIERLSTTYSLTKGSVLPFEVFELEGASFEVFLNGNKITSLVVQDDITILVKYIVVYTYVEAKEATCTEDGNIGYWYSSIYAGYYFADPEGREVIKDVVIPKLNHDIIHLDYKDSTCSEVGNVDCYYCNNCHKHFSDGNAQNELEDWSITKKPHILTHHEKVDATCENDGHVEYWTCQNEPGVYYGDEACETKLEDIIIYAFGHNYLAPTYTWEEVDDGYQCKASIYCTHCHDEISETKLADKLVIREANCEHEGQISYSVRFANERFNAQTKIVKTSKTPHSYVFVEGVKATKDMDGVKEHYECSNCHRYFIKQGDEYNEVLYSELIYRIKSSGCGGSIATPSILLFASAGALSLLFVLKRKEDR